jgi:hypothetical protein
VSELEYIPNLPRAELRAALRTGSGFAPALRVFAEDLLGADGTIDLVGVDEAGRVVVVLIGDEGQDRETVTRALAQRAWVRPRLSDWLQLAPSLPFAADAPVVALLLCPSFSSETVAAAADLGPDRIELASLRCVRNGANATVLVDRLTAAGDPRETGSAPRPPSGGDRSTRFRSGLSEADLGLTPEEISDFE